MRRLYGLEWLPEEYSREWSKLKEQDLPIWWCEDQEPILSKAERVMILLSIFTDDQTAILGCFGAIAVCGMIAALSFRLGPAGKSQSTPQTTIRITRTATSDNKKSQDRRAA